MNITIKSYLSTTLKIQEALLTRNCTTSTSFYRTFEDAFYTLR